MICHAILQILVGGDDLVSLCSHLGLLFTSDATFKLFWALDKSKSWEASLLSSRNPCYTTKITRGREYNLVIMSYNWITILHGYKLLYKLTTALNCLNVIALLVLVNFYICLCLNDLKKKFLFLPFIHFMSGLFCSPVN